LRPAPLPCPTHPPSLPARMDSSLSVQAATLFWAASIFCCAVGLCVLIHSSFVFAQMAQRRQRRRRVDGDIYRVQVGTIVMAVVAIALGITLAAVGASIRLPFPLPRDRPRLG